VKHISGAPPLGRLLALPTNIRLGWRGLAGTNTLVYYEKAKLKRLYITLGPVINVIKLFMAVIFVTVGTYFDRGRANSGANYTEKSFVMLKPGPM
jgi:hypothetical protein